MDTAVDVYAANMIYAQGARLTREQRAILQAKADRYRQITGTSDKTDIRVPVRSIYGQNEIIGHLRYSL